MNLDHKLITVILMIFQRLKWRRIKHAIEYLGDSKSKKSVLYIKNLI